MNKTNHGGRPIKAPRHTLDQTIAALREHLGKQPANVPVWVGRCAMEDLEQASKDRALVYAAQHTEELYANLVTSYNAIWEAAQSLGVEVFQPMGSDAWHWMRGDARGSAPTPAQALIGALQT